MKICTEFVYPPIPFRGKDWTAWFDDLGEDAHTEYAATEQEAISRLKAWRQNEYGQ